MSLALLLLPAVAHAALPGVTDNIWKGTTNGDWGTGTNWSLGHAPTSTEAARFDQNSTANLTINNVLAGVDFSGFANTSLAANNGPTGPMTITGNAMTIGATGLLNISGNPLGPYGYTGPAQADLTVDVDLTLSANQYWKAGGPGTGSTAQPAGNQAIIVGASPNVHTVALNGFRPTLAVISNAFDMIVVNSKLVDGSVPSQVGISKATGTTTTLTFDSGNINTTPRIRISGDSTYSGGTDIIGGRQLIQLATSSVTSGGAIVSGPFGKGPISIHTETLGSGTINNQNPYFAPYLADRTVDNDINLNPMPNGGTPNPSFVTLYNSASTDDATQRTLTLNGIISVPATASLLQNNALGLSNSKVSGAGDAVINGTILLGGADFNSDGIVDAGDYVVWRKNPAAHGGADGYKSFRENFGYTIPISIPTTGIFSVGQAGGAPTFATGKQVFNGNIVQTNSATYTLAMQNGDAIRPAVVRLGGQNTFGAMTVSSVAGSNTAGDANVQIGSSSVLSGSTIVSGPLGTGTVTLSSSAGTSFEAFGAARTVDNPFSLSTNQSLLMVQGTQDLTLNGAISGTAGLTMNGAARLTLGGANTYVGATSVNSGTLLVNGSMVSSPSVSAGSTLGGTGTVSNDISNSGTLAPGVSGVGTLTATGNVTDNAGANWNIDLSGTSSDMLVVGGALDLSAADTLNIAGIGSGASWVIATYTGTLSGTFDTVTAGYSVDYGTGTNSQITLHTPGSGTGGGLSSSVPEPTGALLLVIGLAIGSIRRFR